VGAILPSYKFDDIARMAKGQIGSARD